MRKNVLSRRTVLRGLAAGGGLVTVGLPVLDIMLNSHGEALADGTALPLRFVSWFFGNGMWPQDWVPSAQGPNWPATKLTQPLFDRGVAPYCSILTGFDNKSPVKITHHEGMVAFNGFPFDECNGLCSDMGGPTIDQVVANVIGGATTFPSVHIGVSRAESYMDSGTTMFALSHKGPKQPQYPEANPQEVWNKLFNSFVPKADPSGPLRVSVIDAVRADIAALKKRLGTDDNQRLEAHLESLDAVQKKLEALPPACRAPMKPNETNPKVGVSQEPLDLVNQVMADLVTIAFACDATRVASYLFTYGAGAHIFGSLGQTIEHHNFMSHDEQYVNNGKFQEGVIFEVDAFAYLLEKLMKTPDAAGGNLLDNSVLYMSSDSSWAHNVFDMPIIVAGRGGGALTHPGIHYRSSAKSPGGNQQDSSAENISDILLTMLQVFDPTATSVGGGAPMSTTPFAGLKAAV